MKQAKTSFVVLACILAASMAAFAQNTLEGKWHGEDNNLPIMDLTIQQQGTQVSGNAIFYLIKKSPGDSVAHVDGQAAGAMENLNYQPEKLTFDMHHRDGSLVSFRVQLTDADHARLFRTSDHEPEGAGFPLTRVKP